MFSEKPFIHLIETPYGFYIFDTNTNSIIRTSEDVYCCLKDVLNGIKKEYGQKTVELINNLIEQGYLSSNRPKEMVHPVTEYLEYYLENKLRKITLQVTQHCNFRCEYCVYSEDHNEMQRSHSLVKMSFQTAKKSIDYLIAHSRDFNDISIGFYGGEPLLEFDLVKKCMEYAQTASVGKNLSFSLTTNGSLLTDHIVEFFLKHKIRIMISLDGPKEIQDKHRRLAHNGCGSFEIVERNLCRIQEKYPEFMDQISFNAVVNPQDDFGCVNEFFINHKIMMNASIRGSLIDDSFSNEKNIYTENYRINNGYEYFKAMLSYLGRIDSKKVSPLSIYQFDSAIPRLSKNLGKFAKIPERTSHSGPCIPGAHKLFINAAGQFFPCERVSEESQPMQIGNIESGYEIKKISDLLNICKLTEEKCKKCWAITNCTICPKDADNIKELSPQIKAARCIRVKENIEKNLRDYIALQEVKYGICEWSGENVK